MFRYFLLSILVLSPLALASDGDHGTCSEVSSDITICANGTEVTHVTISRRRGYETLDLKNYTSIAPNALQDLKVFSLTLQLGDPSSCEPKAFDLTAESFNGVGARLRYLYINCWDVPKESNVLKNCPILSKVELKTSSLTEIPKVLLKDLSFLDMFIVEGHRIRSLDDSSFSGMPDHVELMYINDGPLESIQGSPFRNLRGLGRFSLKNNKISDLQPGVFNGLVNVEKLSLELNLIEKIRKNVFTSDLAKLKGIDIRNNRIKDIESGAFYGVSMNGLFLTNNSLETLPAGALDGIKGLSMLELSGNKFSVIPSHYFSDLRDLQWLKINNGALSRIEAYGLTGSKYSSIEIRNNPNLTELLTDAFNGVRGSTVILKMENNNIKIVQDNAFRNADLFTIYLSGNPVEDRNVTRWGVSEKTSVYFRDL
uniref:LRRCT domain-containing protein n=1 Tax=Bracon brevicornis TaxID=1563983 RepID=A0A6V7IKM9_9HYME